jgi:hypothetical protein
MHLLFQISHSPQYKVHNTERTSFRVDQTLWPQQNPTIPSACARARDMLRASLGGIKSKGIGVTKILFLFIKLNKNGILVPLVFLWFSRS